MTAAGFTVGAIVVVNAVGTVTIGETPHFWAAHEEAGREFGGLGAPAHVAEAALSPAIKGDAAPRASTTIAVVATDAILTKASLRHIATMAHDVVVAMALSSLVVFTSGRWHRLRPVDAPPAGR